jgi:tetratricopeptide (TPR) repeat protein
VSSQPVNLVEIFYSYAHEDEKLCNELQKHLANLKRQGLITDWYDRDISAGTEWDDEIEEHLDSAKVILLLISPDFMNSDYSNEVEVKRAMERHEAGEARVIPIILRPVDWEGAPFSKLQGLPTDAKAITLWPNHDEAFLSVVKEIRKALKQLSTGAPNATTPARIPRPPVVGFVSRRDRQGRDIVERLTEELAPHKNQLVALWGPGGTGKTTLAAEATRALTDFFEHRVAWVSPLLRADLTFLTLLDEIASQLGRPDLRTLAPEEKENQVSALIAAAPTLIVLDNFETITPEEEQTKCVAYLAQKASCPALITTRTRIDEAFNIPLAAMSVEEAREFLTRMVEQTRTPAKFDKLDRDDLIQKCEANPLVLQWVVGQIDRALPLKNVLGYLAQGKGDAAERVFTRSFELPQLGDDGRAALLALSLFVPSASREALAQVAGFGTDLDRLDQAVEHLASLWLLEDVDNGERLMLQGLTRELAKVRLTRELRANELRQRFVKYFLEYSGGHAESTAEDYEALETEKDSILSAMDIAFNMRDWSTVQGIAYVLALPVSGMLSVHGYWDEAIRRSRQALRAARELSSEIDIANFAHNSAVIHQNRGEIEEARQLYEESLAINRNLGNQRGIGSSLHQLALLAHDQGEIDDARRLYNESLEILKRLGNQRDIADSLHQFATLAQDQGDLDEAGRLYNESLEIQKKLGNQRGMANTLHQLGVLAQIRGELGEARRLYNESLEINQRLGNQSGIALTLGQLGLLAEDESDNVEATRLFVEALAIFEKLKSPNAEVARESLERVKGKSS